jgi:hypothetical protein
MLTGTYLSLSQSGSPRVLAAEVIRLRHVGERLKGSIMARAEFTLGESGDIENSTQAVATYRYTGRMRARQVLISYWSTTKPSQNGGTMTMALGVDGMTFHGIWCGTATNGQVTSGPCMWIKNARNNLEGTSVENLAETTQVLLRSIENPWREIDWPSIRMSKLLFLDQAMDALARLETETDD